MGYEPMGLPTFLCEFCGRHVDRIGCRLVLLDLGELGQVSAAVWMSKI